MRRTIHTLSICAAVILLSGLTVYWSAVEADTASAPSLTISQLKITSSSGQFITLHNTTDASLDMSRYQLQYFNSFDLSKATSSRLISLSGTLPPYGYYLVNDGALTLCYQMVIESVSLGFSSTGGLLQVLAFSQSSPGSSGVPVLQDYMGWSKTAVNGVQTLPSNASAFLQRKPGEVGIPGAGSWHMVQPETGNVCNLISISGEPVYLEDLPPLISGPYAPSTVISLPRETGAPGMPVSNIGLMAPQINELLPNPEGTGNDSTDEFIELYNPNASSFDLSNSSLQVGLTSLRKYTFPAGTILPAKSFTAFYSEATGLSMSNTKSQVKLLDALGNSVSASQEYASAKDGQSWSATNGKWYWSAALTPNAANVIKQPPASSKKAASSNKSSPKSSSSKSGSSGSAGRSSSFGEEPTSTPVHTKTIALVAGLALLYGAYEYRTDMGNKLYQLRRYLGARFRNRQQA